MPQELKPTVDVVVGEAMGSVGYRLIGVDEDVSDLVRQGEASSGRRTIRAQVNMGSSIDPCSASILG